MKRFALLIALFCTIGLQAQTQPGSYAPVPAPQFFTDSGVPCAGCLLFTYASGTTTPLATYTDIGLTVPNANPIVLDGAGRATIILQQSTYKFVLESTGGITIWTRDTVASIAQLIANSIASTLQVVQTSSSTGTLNDFALTANAGTLRFSNAALTTITGLSAGYDGQSLTIIATGAGVVALADQNAGSAAANRLIVGLSGTVTIARATLQYDATAARWRVIVFDRGAWNIVTTTATGTQNDVSGLVGDTLLLCNNASGVILTGFAAGYDGQHLLVVSNGAAAVALSHQNVGSAAANRLINIVVSNDTPLAAGKGTAEYVYSRAAARWLMVAAEQGAWIVQTYAAGDYTANAGTWTVDVSDVVTFAYRLSGRSLTVGFYLNTTSTGAGMGSDLQIKIPGGFVANQTLEMPTHTGDNNASAIGLAVIASSGTQIILRKIDSSAWTSSVTNLTYVRGGLTFEVQ